jgi:hypothetical protein
MLAAGDFRSLDASIPRRFERTGVRRKGDALPESLVSIRKRSVSHLALTAWQAAAGPVKAFHLSGLRRARSMPTAHGEPPAMSVVEEN